MRKLTLIALAIGATAILAACGGSNSSALTGKNWQLTAITEKVPAFQGVVPPADQTKYVITFNTDGTTVGALASVSSLFPGGSVIFPKTITVAADSRVEEVGPITTSGCP